MSKEVESYVAFVEAVAAGMYKAHGVSGRGHKWGEGVTERVMPTVLAELFAAEAKPYVFA